MNRTVIDDYYRDSPHLKLADLLLEADRGTYRGTLKTFDQHKEEMIGPLVELLDNFVEHFAVGYRVLLAELTKLSEEERRYPIDEFTIKRPRFGETAATLPLRDIFQHPYRVEFGITARASEVFFQITRKMADERRFDAVLDSLIFLTYLCADYPAYWIALGRLYEVMGEPHGARFAYRMAVFSDPTRLRCYQYAVRICCDLDLFEEAEQIVNAGISFVEGQAQSEQEQQFHAQLKQLQQYILQRQGG